ncbi:tetratricopeptide repeat protein [Erythrobacter alti]|uniref:tetratricopeptide repeat protein n=1 Tax=Erythrobacter alti TaxID=1896145 RepID=UPI0030F37262
MKPARHLRRLIVSSALCSVALASAGHLQAAVAQEVVQALPNPASNELSDALRRLSQSPNNVTALLDAGDASLALGDVDGALGFYNRAQARRPDDRRVLLGLAMVAVRRGEGLTAVQLFDNANAAGASMSPVAAERGLAYDLIGNNARAQRLYRQSLSREASDEVIRRLALSYAISGDAAASEATLLPLLQRQDRSAYRSRAFALAILGRDNEAITIAETMLPPRLSGRLAPYLRYMPRLTRAQQAAAANLGRFPAASQIGQDSPQIAALANEDATPASSPASRGDRLTPRGEALGPAQQPAANPQASTPAARTSSGELPAVTTQEVATRPAPQSVEQPPAPPPRERSPVVVATLGDEANFPPAEEARPSFSVSEAVVQSTPTPAPASQPAQAQQAASQLDLAEAFADFSLPGENLPVRPSAGAVDVTAIQPARAPAPQPEPAPPPPPAHPSRHWVQVATGQDIGAFRFDWRRIVRNANGLLDGRDAFTATWNQTNRLVTGPFDSRSAANQFVTELGEAGIDSFRFTSADGEEVAPLD